MVKEQQYVHVLLTLSHVFVVWSLIQYFDEVEFYPGNIGQKPGPLSDFRQTYSLLRKQGNIDPLPDNTI